MTYRFTRALALMACATSAALYAHDDLSKPVIKVETKKIGNRNHKVMTIDGIKVHEGDETLQPQPKVVTPGSASTQAVPGKAPSDAVVIFDGTEETFKNNWTDTRGNPTKWKFVDGAMESVRRAGYIQSKLKFGSCQMHIEFATPKNVQGKGQGRGNSGVFLMGTYEIQVLDSYNNKTYPDGQAGALYGRSKPLVNASRGPGEWQSYDIIFHQPKFDENGKVVRRATFTVFHNGVLIQDHTVLSGGTGWAGPHAATEYKKHPKKLPIKLQDHGNPVRYRNIWVRELKEKD